MRQKRRQSVGLFSDKHYMFTTVEQSSEKNSTKDPHVEFNLTKEAKKKKNSMEYFCRLTIIKTFVFIYNGFVKVTQTKERILSSMFIKTVMDSLGSQRHRGQYYPDLKKKNKGSKVNLVYALLNLQI